MKRVTLTEAQHERLVDAARRQLDAARDEWHPGIPEAEAMLAALESAEQVAV